ncbi:MULTISPECIES: iron-siderophore ABC transporter substrate-binding protein [Rhodococcus]|uniref:iron-siderophore ABC transporter substrate-binding protein n=1 Tax=Rhodococcus TaxID=1827 RepID=UPI0005741D3F|nr:MULTISPECIES: iron-siderophore ABC transporter substrate-binding protein [Rhodococcus]KHJ74388.1 ABC transporter substrate-binding protein [Rhodococcus sp. Chr-9]MBX4170457.1 iron-siderophore ABC transporter substrate-binding protein [Rhodococcus sp. DMU2021]OBA39717.1 ABC transporter substrate-binding protein [Rhodococcus sp. 852002-51564_SCH6189132-a]QXU55045.1 iron-siderophore ABC transporter substrate-binding protein [Rhodococcus sp. LW-XY12]UPW06816.1 iron-siderophore ABC transporter s
MRSKRLLTIAAASVAVALGLTACGSSDSSDTADSGSAGSGEYPITIEHALGTVTLDEKPERVATVNWANHEVPLALGVVPVGMAAANFGDDDGNGMLPWVEERLEELGAETPVLFDETDGIDFEAVSDTNPDVILAAYSGLTQEDYETLSEIAPVVAYPEAPWATSWRDMIELNSAGLGMAEEGEELVASLEQEIADAAAAHPELEGKATMFLTHVDTADLSQVSFYTANDTRAAFFEDLGLATPKSVADASTDDAFSKKVSAEQVDVFDDVQIIVTYGDQELVDALEADPLLSQMPAVRNGSIVFLDGSGPLGTAANPTPLAISWVLSDYVQLLSDAAAKTNAE